MAGFTLGIKAKSMFGKLADQWADQDLIILNSGHNIAPEPIEEKIARLIPAAQQVVVVGNGRGYLCALVTGAVESAAVQAALDAVNPELPHYRQVRNFAVLPDAFTPESGLLTAMAKSGATPSMRNMFPKSTACTIRKPAATR